MWLTRYASLFIISIFFLFGFLFVVCCLLFVVCCFGNVFDFSEQYSQSFVSLLIPKGILNFDGTVVSGVRGV